MAQPAPFIEISGRPYQRGLSYGQQTKARIRRGIDHYGAQLRRLDLDEARMSDLVERLLPLISEFDAAAVEEMNGIAVGADVSFNNIVLINARTEILKLAERPGLLRDLQGTSRVEPDGCTGLVALPKATADGAVLHAQNWDWKSECA